MPIIHLALESPTHSIADAALRSLPIILPALDFSTIKGELFPIVASVFTKTSSLGIKVRTLEALLVLCGGSTDPATNNDGLDGVAYASTSKKSNTSALDKHTMQEKIVPLIKGIKTKEPAVGLAALNVLRQVGGVADSDFVAMEILPLLWTMSLGPLLDLKQFQSFMELIKSLSGRVEQEQTKKLEDLSGSNGHSRGQADDIMSFGGVAAFPANNSGLDTSAEDDFERLVKGGPSGSGVNPIDSGWDQEPVKAAPAPIKPPAFSWSTPSPTTSTTSTMSPITSLRPQQSQVSRTVTPDLSQFNALTPSTTQFSQPLQPQPFSPPPQIQPMNHYSTPLQPQTQQAFQNQAFQSQQTSVNWGAATQNVWASNNMQSSNAPLSPMNNLGSSMSNMSVNSRPAASTQNSFSLPPPPSASSIGSYTAPKPQTNQSAFAAPNYGQFQPQPSGKKGLDAYESLL